MKGRSGALITILGALVLLTMVGGYFLLTDPWGSSAGELERARAGIWDPDDPDNPDHASGDASRDGHSARSGSRDGKGSSRKRSKSGANADGTGEGGAQDAEVVVPVVDPSEIDKPVPGHLLIKVLNKQDDRPLAGTTVYFPIRASKLEAEGGNVKLTDKLEAMVKRTNRHGVAVWNEKELKELLAQQKDAAEKQTSVLITAFGYADIFEPLAIPDLTKGAEAVFKLMPSVRVTGKVREKRGGIVRYAEVEILQTNQQADSANPANRFTIRADGIGEFAVKLAEGYLYTFEVKQSGFAPYTSRVFNFREDRREVSIILERARGISGIVVNTGNQPIEGAEVWARDDGLRVQTDAEGKFTIDMVSDRIYRNDVSLRFSAKGYAPQDKKVLANDHEVRVELETEGTITGVVHNDRGEKIAGAQVRCTYVEGNNRYPYDSKVTNEAGEFSFGGFSTGKVQLTAHLGELYSRIETVATKPQTQAGPVTLTLITGAQVTGRVFAGGTGIEGVKIALDGKPAAATGADGAYTLGGIPDGKHKIKIVNQHPIADEQLRQLPVFTTDGENYYYLPKEREVSLKLADTETLDFEVQPFDATVARKITISVMTRPNAEAQGVQVTIQPTFGAPPKGVEPPKTQVLALDLPGGKASMPLTLLRGVSYEATFIHNRFFEAKLTADALEGVPAGGTVEVVLERAFILKGTVKDSEGNGIENVGLSKDANNPWAMSATTDIYGAFEFGQLKEGEYTITAFKNSYYQEKVQVNIAGSDPAPLDITLVGANEIRIIVTNAGSPQPGAHIDIYRNDAEGDDPDDFKRHFDIGTTDAKGEKYINFHWVRNYQICAQYGNQVAFVNFNNLKAVPEREFTIELEPAFDLTGIVVDAETEQPLGGTIVRAHLAPTGTNGRDGNFFQMQVGSDGRFAFKVPSGDYYFYVPKSSSHKNFTTQGSNVPAGSRDLILAVPVRDDIDGNYAQVLAMSVPTSMVSGEQYQVDVTVRNMGSTTWTSAGNKPWRLGSEAPRDNKTWGMSRVQIDSGIEVRPKDVYTFSFTITAPAAGNHNMQWRMVQDGKEWFGQYSTKVLIAVSAAGG